MEHCIFLTYIKIADDYRSTDRSSEASLIASTRFAVYKSCRVNWHMCAPFFHTRRI